MEVAKNINQKLKEIPNRVKIVAATKYVEAEDMEKLLDLGITNFGENRVDAFLEKYEALKDKPIHWHFIGHLQSNKAKQVVSKIEMLHSLDSLRLAEVIEKECIEPLDCLIEVNINRENSKSGILLDDCEAFLKEVQKYSKVRIRGLMCMTMRESSSIEKQNQFSRLRQLMEELNEHLGLSMKELSMGMSDDYQEAIASGSTIVRLGRMLWEPAK
ncbi:MAG: YggS family pyridoxal phosphate-dependent enzyme [Anaeroplasmataceae bacterium]|nr:YggS family pyridoxal phosphate-dependent enzyme [Anaeroplasmataceae bacterium]